MVCYSPPLDMAFMTTGALWTRQIMPSTTTARRLIMVARRMVLISLFSFLPVDCFSPESVLRSFGLTDISSATLVGGSSLSLLGLVDAVVSLQQLAERGVHQCGGRTQRFLGGWRSRRSAVGVVNDLVPACYRLATPLLGHLRTQSPSLFETLLSEMQRLTQLHETLRPYYYCYGFTHVFLSVLAVRGGIVEKASSLCDAPCICKE